MTARDELGNAVRLYVGCLMAVACFFAAVGVIVLVVRLLADFMWAAIPHG